MTSNHGRFPVGLHRIAGLLCGAAAVVAVSGCDSKPEGQVVAVVNGDEVTAQELNGELAGAQAADGQDQETRNAALNQVVERRLLADIAREEGIESSPDYILRKKKLDETLLVQMLNEKLARDVKQPSAQEIDKLIADNPQAFGNRTLIALDQIVFPAPERSDAMQALASTKTMDEVIAVLNRQGIKFQRGNTTIDSSSLPKEMFAQFMQVGTSEPMIIPTGRVVTVAKILATRPAPVTGAAARPVASQAFVRQATVKNLQDRLAQARENAEIEYQTGFSALGDAGGASTGATTGLTPSPTATATPR